MRGKENITAFLEIESEISKLIEEEDLLDILIEKAHEVLYKVFTENYSYDA